MFNSLLIADIHLVRLRALRVAGHKSSPLTTYSHCFVAFMFYNSCILFRVFVKHFFVISTGVCNRAQKLLFTYLFA